MRTTGGRHELKHYINQGDFIELRTRLPCVFKRDDNTDTDGGYRVRSLYFDNYNDKVLREKIDGIDDREKFRIRFYKNNPAFIRLEKKSKKSGLCFKESELISFSACEALLRGDYDVLKTCGKLLHLELYAKMHHQHLRPRNIVDYQRNAFVFPAGNVRVTLDYDIRSSEKAADFLNPVYVTVPIPEMFILEVKYDNFLPEIVRGITTLASRQASAFSKYAATRII